MNADKNGEESILPRLGLVGGPLAFVAMLLLPPPAGLTTAAWAVAATTLLMVIWWICEALPVAATALLPVVAFPLLGVADMSDATAPYAHPLIFLFRGGFLIAKAIERWNLHRRIALSILKAVGSAPHLLVGGFMTATALLSMWLSNTATTIMLLPIALAVVSLLPGLGISDPGIAMLGGLVLFAIPSSLRRGRFLLDWEAAKTLPWGVLILFGGGLNLASAIQASGLAAWIGDLLADCADWPAITLVLLVTALVVFLTEVTSNTATASVFIPIAATLGACTVGDPALYAVPVALAASCAFMMPVATPPNTIVYASGAVAIPQMAKAGLLLNIHCILVITAAVYWTAGWLLGLAVEG